MSCRFALDLLCEKRSGHFCFLVWVCKPRNVLVFSCSIKEKDAAHQVLAQRLDLQCLVYSGRHLLMPPVVSLVRSYMLSLETGTFVHDAARQHKTPVVPWYCFSSAVSIFWLTYFTSWLSFRWFLWLVDDVRGPSLLVSPSQGW